VHPSFGFVPNEGRRRSVETVVFGTPAACAGIAASDHQPQERRDEFEIVSGRHGVTEVGHEPVADLHSRR